MILLLRRCQVAIENIGFGFASEEDAALFGLHDLAELEASKPEISVVSLGSYTQIDPSFCCRRPPMDSDPTRSHSDPQIKSDDLVAFTPVQVRPGDPTTLDSRVCSGALQKAMGK